MEQCIFCKMVNNEIPVEKIFESENVIAFNDINPQAPIHCLIIPKKHIVSADFLKKEDADILMEIFEAIRAIAKKRNLSENGYRIVTNHGERAGQSVFHLHFHLLGGRNMKWPPG